MAFFDRQKMQLIRKVGMPGSVSALHWHSRLNQILAGIGDRKSGSCRVLYDTAVSERGVLQVRRLAMSDCYVNFRQNDACLKSRMQKCRSLHPPIFPPQKNL